MKIFNYLIGLFSRKQDNNISYVDDDLANILMHNIDNIDITTVASSNDYVNFYLNDDDIVISLRRGVIINDIKFDVNPYIINELYTNMRTKTKLYKSEKYKLEKESIKKKFINK